MIRRALAAVLFVMAGAPALAQTTTTAPPADPGIGIRLTEAPKNRENDPRARRYIVDHVNAGATFSRGIEVSNGTDRDVTVVLYAAAATLNNGEFVPASGRTQNDLSGWMKVEPGSLSIPRGGKAAARVTITVPADATAGERYAVALVELPPAPGAGLVGLASRVGVRVYLSVGPGSEPPTDFDLKTFEPINEDGKPGVSIHSCNTGGRALDLGGSLRLADGPGGISAGPFESSQPATISPGQCENLKILLDPALPRGPWRATASLRSGTREKSAEATITFPEPGQKADPVAAKETGKTSDAPLVAAGAVLLFLAVAAGLFLLWRRRHSTPTAA